MTSKRSASKRSTARPKRPHGERGPRSRWTSAIASIRGSERTLSSVPSTAARRRATSSPSPAPSTTRRMISSVSRRIRSSVTTRPRHGASSRRASSSMSGSDPRMRSPRNRTRIARRSRMCSSPSRSRIECGPANGRRNSQLSPAGAIAGSRRKISRTASGCEKRTIGSSVQYVRIVAGSPNRSWTVRMKAAGRAIQAIVCQAAGARGPGGRSMTPEPTRAVLAGAPSRGPARHPRDREPPRGQLPYGEVMALTVPLSASPAAAAPSAPDVADLAASLAEPQRFHAVVDRHFDAIAAFLSRRVGPDVAEDLAQETFIAAVRARARLDPPLPPPPPRPPARFAPRFASARPWLLGIAPRGVASHRREERRQLELYRRAAAAASVRPADPAAAPLDPALFDGLHALARRDRDAFLLHVWGELSYEETAAALGVPVDTVRSRINRARRKLTDHLSGANA